MFKVQAQWSMRQRKQIIVESSPSTTTLSPHWWSSTPHLRPDLTFTCTLDSYDNPYDYLPCGDIINVASGRLIRLFQSLSIELDVYETHWPGAPAAFLQADYRVFRIAPTSGLVDLNQSIYGVDQHNRPAVFSRIVFHDPSPPLFRPMEFTQVLVCSAELVAAVKKGKFSGMEFVAL